MSKLTKELVDQFDALMDGGLTQTKACKELGIPESTYRGWRNRGLVDALREEASINTESSITEVVEDPEELEALCEDSDIHVANLAKRLRTAQKTNSQLRKVINGTVDQTSHFNDMVRAVEIASTNISCNKFSRSVPKPTGPTTKVATAEILFSDFQVGKVGQYYNTKLALSALRSYGDQVLQQLCSGQYSIERIVLACLGDTVEDHLKHGVQSATSTDSGLAEQMAVAIEGLWQYVIKPLGELNIPMEVICIAGNHGSSAHTGMDMYKAGLFSYDYPIYKALEGYCKASGWSHVRFNIPEGVFAHTEIYGRTAVYEHGYFNGCTEKNLQDQKAKRSRQLKKHCEYMRVGDMHHVCDYNNGQEVVNGAFFGVDCDGIEYSGILGFNSIPAQKLMIHTPESCIGKNTIKENINIQVAHGY